LRGRLEHWSTPKRIAALVVSSTLLTALFVALRLPAAFLIGPMIAAAALSISGATVALPKWPLFAAQAIVGAMIAGSFPAEAFTEMVRDWPLILFGTVSTVAASMSIGIVLTRAGVMPGTTAIWGSAPGAASVMTFMSADYGADMRLVALMQYLRVATCVLLATVVARVVGPPSPATALAVLPPAPWQAHAATLVLTLLTGWIGVRFKIPGGAFLFPMLVAIGINVSGIFHVALPGPVLALAYGLLGCVIGMRFTMDVLGYAASALPRLMAAVVALLALCAGLGWVISRVWHIDFLTAYLATNPGGADSVAIIATGMHVDMAFVMAMQLARFLLIMLAGPTLARLVSQKFAPKPPSA
jgi:membrane AbrB-like protein